jgi:hypothetical protein
MWTGAQSLREYGREKLRWIFGGTEPLMAILIDPVVVQIHAGTLVAIMGSTHDGSIITATENAVVNTIQYGLGILGFFR